MLKSFAALLVILVFSAEIFSAVSIQVFSMDEGVNEKNMHKPKIYIINNGDETVSDFVYKYSFKTASDEIPIIESYYVPNATISIESIGDKSFTITYDFTGRTIKPGKILPNRSGNTVGIHYSDWSEMDVEVGLSNNGSDVFIENPNIKVYSKDGELINSIPEVVSDSIETSNKDSDEVLDPKTSHVE